MEVPKANELQKLMGKGPKIVIDSLLNLLASLQADYLEVQEECLRLKKKPKLSLYKTIDIDIPPEKSSDEQQTFTLQKLREAIIQYSAQSDSTHQQYKNTINQIKEENTELHKHISQLEKQIVLFKASSPKKKYPEGVLTPLGSAKHRLLKLDVPQTEKPQSKHLFTPTRIYQKSPENEPSIPDNSPLQSPGSKKLGSSGSNKSSKPKSQSPNTSEQTPDRFVTPRKGSST